MRVPAASGPRTRRNVPDEPQEWYQKWGAFFAAQDVRRFDKSREMPIKQLGG